MRSKKYTLITAMLIILESQLVDAYINPGSGSFLFQLFIGGLVALTFVLKTNWSKLKNFFATLFLKER